jgi:hypothetical protein
MWKRTLVSSVVLACLAAPIAAWANPPSAMKATYDAKRGELDVLVEHPVSNPETHYIKEVEVTKNGAVAQTLTFTSQSSRRNQTMPPIKFSMAPNDVVAVKAACNLWGSKTVAVELPSAGK